MKKRRARALRTNLLAGLLGATAALAASAADTKGCAAYAVDVSQDVAAMQTPQTRVEAAAAAPAALRSGTVYRLRLSPQQGFAFVAAPERRQLDEGAYAGLAQFSVPTAGRWRVNLGGASWIDIVDAEGRLLPAGRFEGHEECAIRKWVEFPLEADVRYTLQLSGGAEAELTVMISGPLPDAP